MKKWSFCFAYVLCFDVAMAQSQSLRAVEMAECGYVSALAAQQLQGQPEREGDLDKVVSYVVDFTNLYYALRGKDVLQQGEGITQDMYRETTEKGRVLFERRISAMSRENATKLANTLLVTCQEDLLELAKKIN